RIVSVRFRDLVMVKLAAADRAFPNPLFDSRGSVPDFVDFVAADYSWPAAEIGSAADLGFAADRSVIAAAVAVAVVAVAVAVAVVRPSFDPSCSADFFAARAAVASDV